MRLALARAGVGTLLVLVLVTGCGGSSNSTPTGTAADKVDNMTTGQTKQELAQTYVRITDPANAAAQRFGTKAGKWNANTTGAQAEKDVAPFVDAIQKADDELLRVDWPAPTAADIKDLIKLQGALIGDLHAIKDLNALSLGNWETQFRQDAGRVSAGAKIVRADLGRPPANP